MTGPPRNGHQPGPPPDTRIAIIGLGSRGLSVLERIITLAKLAGPAAGRLRVDLVDPSCAGAGVHDPGQPDYLLLNTTCAQVSMFPDACTVGADVDAPGPSLHEWVTSRGLRLAADGFTVGASGRAIRPADFLPRRILGEYLGWFLGQLRQRAPGHVRLVLHRAEAVAADRTASGELAFTLSDGSTLRAGYAFLTTGYTANASPGPGAPGGHAMISEPYPLPDRVREVAPGQTVAISGFGLSAMDLMSCLTVGRGGRFSAGEAGLRYQPSGREPRLLLYSRSGVPCRARPLVVEFGPRYEPLALTRTAIDELRAARRGPLDFDTDVLPLVLTEMRVGYRRCEARLAGAEPELRGQLSQAAGRGQLGRALDELDARHGRFDPAGLLDGSAGMRLAGSAAYQRWLAGVISADLAEGLAGFTRSPVKAALDILRELRDTFRYAADYGGLTGPSLEEYNRRVIPQLNRAVVGPQYERHAELLALMRAGVLAAPFGPAPGVAWDQRAGQWTVTSSRLAVPCRRAADWVVAGHASWPEVDLSASALISSLRRAGWIRRHRPGSVHVRGVDVDSDQHPLDASGRPQRRLWMLGPLCEGAVFYTNLVPSPRVWSRPIFDAHRCVAQLLAAAAAGRPAVLAGEPGSG
ncbi:MAG TPA: FAD/NAD(P)-binding protein [Streptosporangiaceae bacterium]